MINNSPDAAPQGLNFPISKIRADFPILTRRVYGKPLVYLDSAASAQKPRAVINAMRDFIENDYANVHRGLYFLSNTATDRFEQARRIVGDFFNAASSDEIIFTHSATEAINMVANSVALSGIKPGDEIILTIMEHHSNIIPWHFLRERLGAKLRWIPVNSDGSFNIEAFADGFNRRTRFAAITHMSNVLGSVVPIKQAAKIAHDNDVPILIDGSQGAVHLPVDVVDSDVDFYIATGHKLYGPTGIGILYGKKQLLREMAPFNGGGEMIGEVTCDWVSYAEPPQRFEAGTPPIIEAIGLGAALDYINSIGRDAIFDYERHLTGVARAAFDQLSGVRVIGNAVDKGGIFTFVVDGVHAHDISAIIDREGVGVRAGTHCAQPLFESYGLTSTCRASFGLYNTVEEIERLMLAIDKAKSFFK